MNKDSKWFSNTVLLSLFYWGKERKNLYKTFHVVYNLPVGSRIDRRRQYMGKPLDRQTRNKINFWSSIAWDPAIESPYLQFSPFSNFCTMIHFGAADMLKVTQLLHWLLPCLLSFMFDFPFCTEKGKRMKKGKKCILYAYSEQMRCFSSSIATLFLTYM